MKTRILPLTALFMLMLITGVFWGTWFTLTRSLDTFSPDEFIHIGKTIIANVAVPMRFIMPTGIILMAVSLWFAENKRSAGFAVGMVSLALIVGVLLVTLIVLVPIDNSIKTWTVATIPADWETMRETWDQFHTLRTFGSLVSFACFSYFVMACRLK